MFRLQNNKSDIACLKDNSTHPNGKTGEQSKKLSWRGSVWIQERTRNQRCNRSNESTDRQEY